MLLELVVPSKAFILAASQPKCGRPRGDSHPCAGLSHPRMAAGPWVGRFCGSRASGAPCRKGFGVHQAMFDGHLQQSALFDRRKLEIRLAATSRIPASSCSRRRMLYSRTRSAFGQSFGSSVGNPPSTGSMPNAKSLVKAGVEGRKAKRFAQKIPVECFQVSQIKNNPVAFRHRAVVQCCGVNDLKQLFTPAPRRLEASSELIDAGTGRHGLRIQEFLQCCNGFASQRLGKSGLWARASSHALGLDAARCGSQYMVFHRVKCSDCPGGGGKLA